MARSRNFGGWHKQRRYLLHHPLPAQTLSNILGNTWHRERIFGWGRVTEVQTDVRCWSDQRALRYGHGAADVVVRGDEWGWSGDQPVWRHTTPGRLKCHYAPATGAVISVVTGRWVGRGGGCKVRLGKARLRAAFATTQALLRYRWVLRIHFPRWRRTSAARQLSCGFKLSVGFFIF